MSAKAKEGNDPAGQLRPGHGEGGGEIRAGRGWQAGPVFAFHSKSPGNPLEVLNTSTTGPGYLQIQRIITNSKRSFITLRSQQLPGPTAGLMGRP